MCRKAGACSSQVLGGTGTAAASVAGQFTREAVLLEMGEMLLVVQHFEQVLLAALLVDDAEATAEAVLLRDRSTLGALFKRFSQKVDLPSDFAHSFVEVLERRNIFVHRLFMEPWFELNSEEGLHRVHQYMRELRAHLKVALHVLIAVAHSGRGASVSATADSRVAHILERIEITVRPEFGGLTADEYVNKVVQRAVDHYSVNRKG